MYKYIFVVFLGIWSGMVYGEDQRMGIGIMGTYSAMEVDDPNGSTDTSSEFDPALAYTLGIKKDTRLYVTLNFFDFKLDGSQTQIGQTVEGYMLAVSYQKRLRLARKFHAWAGGGLSFSDMEYTNRFTVDQDGFLDQVFPNRDEQQFGGQLNFGQEFGLSRSVDIGYMLQYHLTFTEGLSGFMGSVALFYKF